MMHFSIFENDDTLGDLTGRAGGSIALPPHIGGRINLPGVPVAIGGATGRVQPTARRELTLRVSGYPGSLPGAAFLVDELGAVRSAFTNAGWDVLSIRKISTNIGGFGLYSFELLVSVGSNYTDAEIVSRARQALAQALSGPTVEIVRSSVRYVDLPPGVADSSTALGGGFLESLGLGLGVSTPMALGGAALLLVLLLRR